MCSALIMGDSGVDLIPWLGFALSCVAGCSSGMSLGGAVSIFRAGGFVAGAGAGLCFISAKGWELPVLPVCGTWIPAVGFAGGGGLYLHAGSGGGGGGSVVGFPALGFSTIHGRTRVVDGSTAATVSGALDLPFAGLHIPTVGDGEDWMQGRRKIGGPELPGRLRRRRSAGFVPDCEPQRVSDIGSI